MDYTSQRVWLWNFLSFYTRCHYLLSAKSTTFIKKHGFCCIPHKIQFSVTFVRYTFFWRLLLDHFLPLFQYKIAIIQIRKIKISNDSIFDLTWGGLKAFTIKLENTEIAKTTCWCFWILELKPGIFWGSTQGRI